MDNNDNDGNDVDDDDGNNDDDDDVNIDVDKKRVFVEMLTIDEKCFCLFVLVLS